MLDSSDNTEGSDTNDEEREEEAENKKENIVGGIRRKTPRWSTAGFRRLEKNSSLVIVFHLIPLDSGMYFPHPRSGGSARRRLHVQETQMRRMIVIFLEKKHI